MDADTRPWLAVVVAGVVDLHSPELHTVASPAAEVVEDWNEISHYPAEEGAEDLPCQNVPKS